MTTNDVHAREDRLSMGRLELVMKLFTGYEEPENVFDALDELEKLNNAHNDFQKVSFLYGPVMVPRSGLDSQSVLTNLTSTDDYYRKIMHCSVYVLITFCLK